MQPLLLCQQLADLLVDYPIQSFFFFVFTILIGLFPVLLFFYDHSKTEGLESKNEEFPDHSPPGYDASNSTLGDAEVHDDEQSASSLVDQREIEALKTLYYSTGGPTLWKIKWDFEASVDKLHGVETDKNSGKVVRLLLADNGLEGRC
jgi:hypothetical protein